MSGRAGNYRHRVDVLAKTVVKDTIGSPKETWGTQFRIWTEIKHEFRPSDHFTAVSATQTYEDRMWFITQRGKTFTTQLRLRHRGRTYEILNIRDEESEGNYGIRLLCREVTP